MIKKKFRLNRIQAQINQTRQLMSSSPYRSVSAEIENMDLALYQLRPYSTLNKKSCGKYCLYSVQMYGVFHALFRGPNSHNSVWKDTDQLKIVFYRLTPRSKTYSLTFLYDEFMMYKGLYNFQLYSLHKQSILMYLGTLSCKDIGIKKVEFVAKTKFLKSTKSKLVNVFLVF